MSGPRPTDGITTPGTTDGTLLGLLETRGVRVALGARYSQSTLVTGMKWWESERSEQAVLRGFPRPALWLGSRSSWCVV